MAAVRCCSPRSASSSSSATMAMPIASVMFSAAARVRGVPITGASR